MTKGSKTDDPAPLYFLTGPLVTQNDHLWYLRVDLNDVTIRFSL